MSKKQLTHENGVQSTSNLRTAKEWFLTMGEPASSLAIGNSNYKKLHLFYPSLERALEKTFDWDTTPEGYEFWKNIFEQLSLVYGIAEKEEECETEIDQHAINRRLDETIKQYKIRENNLLVTRAQIVAELQEVDKFLTDLKLIRDGQK